MKDWEKSWDGVETALNNFIRGVPSSEYGIGWVANELKQLRKRFFSLETEVAMGPTDLANERQFGRDLTARLVAIRDQANNLTGFGCNTTEDAFQKLVERYKSWQSMLQEARSEIEELKKSREAYVEKDDVDREFRMLCLDLIDEVLKGYKISQEEEELGRIGWAKAAIHKLKKEREELANTKAELRTLEKNAQALVHAITAKYPDRMPTYFPTSDYVGWLTRGLEEALSVYKSHRAEFEAVTRAATELTSLRAENQALKEEVLKVERQLAEDFEAHAEERSAWLDLETTALLLADYAAPEPREEPTYRPLLERVRWGTSRLRRAMRTLQRHIDLIPEVRGKFERLERELSVLKDQVVGNFK